MTPQPVHISSLAHVGGPPRDLNELDELDPEQRDLLRSEGLDTFTELGPGSLDALWDCVAHQVDAIDGPFRLLVSTSVEGDLPRPGSSRRQALLDQGCEGTLVVAGNGCADFGFALDLARSMVLADVVPHVAIVTFDCTTGARYIPRDATVQSDAGTVALVSRAAVAGPSFELLAIGTAAVLREDGAAGRLQTTADRVEAAAARALAAAHVSADDVAHVLTNNYGDSVRDYLAESAGLRLDAVVPDAARQLGHLPTGDLVVGLIRLADATSPGPVAQPGAIIAGVLTAPESCAVAILRAS